MDILKTIASFKCKRKDCWLEVDCDKIAYTLPWRKEEELQELLAHLSICIWLVVCDLFFPVVDLNLDI